MIKDSFSTDEEQVFLKLHQTFLELTQKYPEKSIYDMTDLFMKVSGDIQALKDLLAGNKVVTWDYLEDLALSNNENSSDYRLLLSKKGKDEIEKRKYFLLRVSGHHNQDGESLAGRSAMKKSVVSSQMSGSVRKNNSGDVKMGDVP